MQIEILSRLECKRGYKARYLPLLKETDKTQFPYSLMVVLNPPLRGVVTLIPANWKR